MLVVFEAMSRGGGAVVNDDVPYRFSLRLFSLATALGNVERLAEYALILALIAIIALIFLGGQVSKVLSTVGSSIQTRPAPMPSAGSRAGPALGDSCDPDGPGCRLDSETIGSWCR